VPSGCPVIASTGVYVGHASWRAGRVSCPIPRPKSTSGTSGTTTTQTKARLATGTSRRPGPVGTPKSGSTKVASRTEGLRPCGWRRARAIDQACAALSRGWPPGGCIFPPELSRRSVRRCTSTSNRASPRFSTRVVAEASRQETAPPTSAMAATIPATATGRAARTTRDMPPVCGTRRLPRSAASHTTITRRGRILCAAPLRPAAPSESCGL
jgi:hypothetical protein